MDLAIDIGGSKTLLAVFSPDGEILAKHKFATGKKYPAFLNELKTSIHDRFSDYQLQFGCCAVPGLLDRKKGVALAFGNLDWKNIPIKHDISQIADLTLEIENDSKLAALSEATLVQEKYKKVIYITISTGIGAGVIINGKIDHDLIDSEVGQMILPFEGKLQRWESFASGKALLSRFGKKASELEDP